MAIYSYQYKFSAMPCTYIVYMLHKAVRSLHAKMIGDVDATYVYQIASSYSG